MNRDEVRKAFTAGKNKTIKGVSVSVQAGITIIKVKRNADLDGVLDKLGMPRLQNWPSKPR